MEDRVLSAQPAVSTASTMSTWELFLRAHAAVLPLLEAELADAGVLPLNRYDALVNLAQSGGTMSFSRLVSSMVLSQPSVSRLVDALEREGMVEREPSPEDRRERLVVLTRHGEQELGRASAVHLAGVREHFARHLTPEQDACLGEALARVLEAARPSGGGAVADGRRRARHTGR